METTVLDWTIKFHRYLESSTRRDRDASLKMFSFENFFFCKLLYFWFIKCFELVKLYCLFQMWLASDWVPLDGADMGLQIPGSISSRQRRPLPRSRWFHSLTLWELFHKATFSKRDFLIREMFRWHGHGVRGSYGIMRKHDASCRRKGGCVCVCACVCVVFSHLCHLYMSHPSLEHPGAIDSHSGGGCPKSCPGSLLQGSFMGMKPEIIYRGSSTKHQVLEMCIQKIRNSQKPF